MSTKLEKFRTEDAALIPQDYPDGPPEHRLPVGDALYVTWILSNARMLACARYGVSELVHKLGSDNAVTAKNSPLKVIVRQLINIPLMSFSSFLI